MMWHVILRTKQKTISHLNKMSFKVVNSGTEVRRWKIVKYYRSQLRYDRQRHTHKCRWLRAYVTNGGHRHTPTVNASIGWHSQCSNKWKGTLAPRNHFDCVLKRQNALAERDRVKARLIFCFLNSLRCVIITRLEPDFPMCPMKTV